MTDTDTSAAPSHTPGDVPEQRAGVGEADAPTPADRLVDRIDVSRKLRELRQLRNEVGDIERDAKRERDRIDDWQRQEFKRLDHDIRKCEQALRAFAEEKALEDGTRTYRTPWGRLELTVPEKPLMKIADKGEVLAWAEANRPDLVTVKESRSVAHADLLAALTVTDSAAIDPATGEVVPGVDASVPPPRFKVVTDDVEDAL